MRKLLLVTIVAFTACFATLVARNAKADIVLDNIVPQLTKCWGTTCVMPDASVNATLFNIKSKQWEVGTTSLGAGLALLFAADSAYSSGIALDVTGVLTQRTGASSFAMPTVGLILARYLKIGYSYRIASGEPNSSYISVAGNLPWDVFTTATIPTRKAAAVRAESAKAAQQ